MKPLKTVVATALMALSLTGAALAGQAFPSPEAATKAFIAALQSKDKAALTTIFGPDLKRLEAADAGERAAVRTRLLRLLKEGWSLTTAQDQSRVIRMGYEGWSFPVPLVKTGSNWSFNTPAGEEEIANRRVGRNELVAMETMRLMNQAQTEYHDKMTRYTSLLASSLGQKNGLYWPASDGGISPLQNAFGDPATFASSRTKGTPWYGYYFNLTLSKDGYTLTAWPQTHGRTGVMSFWTNQGGQIYQKDLGSNAGSFLRSFDATSNPQGWDLANF